MCDPEGLFRTLGEDPCRVSGDKRGTALVRWVNLEIHECGVISAACVVVFRCEVLDQLELFVGLHIIALS